jgi:hypothetical protein
VVRTKRDSSHQSSAPLHPGAGSGPGKGYIPDRGGPELAVSDNANLRADGFKPENVPLRNASPATYGQGAVAKGQEGRGGVGKINQ